MSFAEAVRACLSRYATFRGRARRSEFWWFALFVFAVGSALGLLDAALFGTDPAGGGVLSLLFTLAMLLPNLAVSVRRLHDVGRSGWWYLVILVPLVGPLVLLWWWTRDSEPGANDHGPNPKGPAPPGAAGNGGAAAPTEPSRIPSVGRERG